uniref:Uncharacterized protein n=1 Tax=Arundo donax TaxID=35708 RepID=A0A0A9BMA6_ARUDO
MDIFLKLNDQCKRHMIMFVLPLPRVCNVDILFFDANDDILLILCCHIFNLIRNYA